MNVGFIGLALMGSGMAAHILRAGHVLSLHYLRKEATTPLLEKGAKWADTRPRSLGPSFSPRGLAERRRMVRPFDELEVVRRLHRRPAETGVDSLDAPASGGPSGAARGQLAIWVGSERGIFDR